MAFFEKKDNPTAPSPFGKQPGTKVCSRCKQTLDFSEFRAHRKTSDGLNAWCKPCDAAYKREKYAARKKEKQDVGVQ